MLKTIDKAQLDRQNQKIFDVSDDHSTKRATTTSLHFNKKLAKALTNPALLYLLPGGIKLRLAALGSTDQPLRPELLSSESPKDSLSRDELMSKNG